jgi:2-methylisocitrate lyase-like PEP mutase family enzyme
MKNALDADFVIMAQCYTRDAANGGLEECLRRLQAYKEVAGVDWVQFESPHSIAEIQQARAVVSGPFSFMRGRLPRYLSLEEHRALGVYIAWYPAFTHEVMYAALWDFLQDFQAHGLAAWEAFVASRQARPYVRPQRLASGETAAIQQELEARYYSPTMLEKYQRAPGHNARD